MDEEREEQKATKSITVRAVITRKDGTVEDLGVIAEGDVAFDSGLNDPPKGG